MKLIAIHTVHGRKVVREAGEGRNPKDRRRGTVDIIAKPGDEFDTAEFSISDEEADALIQSGAAKRKMREVTEADETTGKANAAPV